MGVVIRNGALVIRDGAFDVLALFPAKTETFEDFWRFLGGYSVEEAGVEALVTAEMEVDDLVVTFLDVDTLEDMTALGESVSFLVKRASLVAVILGSEMLRLGMLFVVDLFLDIFLFLGLVMDKQSTNYTAIIILKIGVRVFINLYFF